jgi:hypothetical protein
MTEQKKPSVVEGLNALAGVAKSVFTLLVLGIVGWAVLSSCLDHPSHTSSSSMSSPVSSTTVTPSAAASPTTVTSPTHLLSPDMFGPAYTPAPTWSPGEADFLFAIHAAFHDDPLARDHPDEVLVDWGRTTCGLLRTANRDGTETMRSSPS